MPSLPHLVQYQGSKRNLAKRILRFLPNSIDRLVEPFAGTAAMSIAVSSNEISSRFWLNDLNEALVQLLTLTIEEPEYVAECYSAIWNGQHYDSVAHYFDIREQFNENNDPTLFLYLLARCVKGSVRYNSSGLFNQSPDKRRKGTKPETMRKNIMGVSDLLKGRCKFTSWDYREVLESIEDNDFVYLDPPYQGVCDGRDSRYLSGISFDEFVVALDKLNRRDIAFAISYDGRLGNKSFGKCLPKSLGLEKVEIDVGRSSQSTLLGRKECTVESLYLSSTTSQRLTADEISTLSYVINQTKPLTLLEKHEQLSATG